MRICSTLYRGCSIFTLLSKKQKKGVNLQFNEDARKDYRSKSRNKCVKQQIFTQINLSWIIWFTQALHIIEVAIRISTKQRGFSRVLWIQKYDLSSGQCTRPQKCFGNEKIKGSALGIFGTSTLFPRFGSLWLLSLPKTQTLPRWSAFFFESRGDCSCRGVFCRSYVEPLQGLDNGAGASLE